MTDLSPSRRRLMLAAGGLAGVALVGCGKHPSDADPDGEVTANEDLMREHGIIRRALFVYSAASRTARERPAAVPLPSLLDAARLFREFAEDYHERGLEEAHIFPVVRALKTPVAHLPDVLLAQHQRGREITDYIRKVAAGSSLAASEAARFADTLDRFVVMYGPHAAREDTELFPAWKTAVGESGYEQMSEQFEEIEQRMFGHDGFDEALNRITRIEAAFGLSDLAAVTAPPPPKI